MTNYSAEDILPCPFCGKPPFVEMTGFHLGGRTIRCETEDCMGPHTTAACINDAAVQWNRRLASMPDREAIIQECIDVASRYDDCGVSFVIEKLRDLALTRALETEK